MTGAEATATSEAIGVGAGVIVEVCPFAATRIGGGEGAGGEFVFTASGGGLIDGPSVSKWPVEATKPVLRSVFPPPAGISGAGVGADSGTGSGGGTGSEPSPNPSCPSLTVC